LRNEELFNSYSSPNIMGDVIKENEAGWACSTDETEEQFIPIFGGIP
jgi:hypothetical protein